MGWGGGDTGAVPGARWLKAKPPQGSPRTPSVGQTHCDLRRGDSRATLASQRTPPITRPYLVSVPRSPHSVSVPRVPSRGGSKTTRTPQTLTPAQVQAPALPCFCLMSATDASRHATRAASFSSASRMLGDRSKGTGAGGREEVLSPLPTHNTKPARHTEVHGVHNKGRGRQQNRSRGTASAAWKKREILGGEGGGGRGEG